MQTSQIPNQEKFNQLVAGLTNLEPVALELSRDPVHCQSGQIGAVVSRIRGALENLGFHTKALAEQPAPPAPETPAPPAAPKPAAK